MAITSENILEVNLEYKHMEHVRKYAKTAVVGGRSQVRATDERSGTIVEDNLIGQICTAAGHLHYRGNLDEYIHMRKLQDENPEIGDKGQDFMNLNIDVKGSLMRASNNPMRYCLPVRPHELYVGWIYWLALCESYEDWEAKVWLVGWATSEMFPDYPDTDGPFAGAHTRRAKVLNPFMPIRRAAGERWHTLTVA